MNSWNIYNIMFEQFFFFLVKTLVNLNIWKERRNGSLQEALGKASVIEYLTQCPQENILPFGGLEVFAESKQWCYLGECQWRWKALGKVSDGLRQRKIIKPIESLLYPRLLCSEAKLGFSHLPKKSLQQKTHHLQRIIFSNLSVSGWAVCMCMCMCVGGHLHAHMHRKNDIATKPP